MRDVASKEHFFCLPLKTTVSELNEKMRQRIGKTKWQERYVYNGMNMSFSKKLEDYNVEENGTIHQLYRLLG